MPKIYFNDYRMNKTKIKKLNLLKKSNLKYFKKKMGLIYKDFIF